MENKKECLEIILNQVKDKYLDTEDAKKLVYGIFGESEKDSSIVIVLKQVFDNNITIEDGAQLILDLLTPVTKVEKEYVKPNDWTIPYVPYEPFVRRIPNDQNDLWKM